MKTLYVSDLDGTLLRKDQRTSTFTNQVINDLVERGICFSYATARSYHTAHKATAGMTAAFPLIVYNGASIRDNRTGKVMVMDWFPGNTGVEIVRELTDSCISPIVYAFFGEEEKFSYLPDQVSRSAADFLSTRAGDVRNRPVDTLGQLTEGRLFYITCIDDPEKLEPFYRKYRDRYHCVYHRDIYSGDQWLEIMPQSATKAHAAVQLASMLGCDRIVAFGDGLNDLDLFTWADEAYAVENAVPELKAAATAVIGSNEDDGVAHWLLHNAK